MHPRVSSSILQPALATVLLLLVSTVPLFAQSYFGNQSVVTSGLVYPMTSSAAQEAFRFTARANTVPVTLHIMGYATGTMPAIQVGIEGPGTLPNTTKTYLCSSPATVLTNTTQAWLDLPLSPAVTLTSNSDYHVVFSYSSGTGATTSNCFNLVADSPMTPQLIPYDQFVDTQFNVEDFNTTSLTWSVNTANNLKPLFVLDFSDGSQEGNPYDTVHTSATNTILGQNWTGEHFQVTNGDHLISSIEVYGNIAGAPGSLTGVLYDETKASTLAAVTVAASQFTTAAGWVSVGLASPVTLLAADQYRVYFNSSTSTSGNDFILPSEANTLGTSIYLNDTFGGTNSYMINSTNGGVAWNNIPADDISFRFSVIPPTPTPTDTATSTPTNTSTATPSSTPAATPSFTASSTATSTATNTSTGTTTATATNTATSTATNTPTDSMTATPSLTASSTATSTASATASQTPSDTATLTVTNTATSTATDSTTATPSASPTNTGTSSPSSTPTATVSSTPTQTGTDTATSTASATASQTPSNTATSTATATTSDTPTSTPTDTPTLTPSATASQTPTNTSTQTGTNTATSTFANTATNTATDSTTATPSASPTNTGTSSPSSTPTATVSTTPTRTGTGTATSTASATLTNTTTPTATATATHTATTTATNTATDSATSTPSLTPSQTPTATQTGTPSATPSFTPSQTPSNTASSTASASPSPTTTNTPTLSATLTATNTATYTATHTLTATPSLTASFTASNTATPTTSNTPVPTVTSTPSATPSYSPTITFTPTITLTFTPTGLVTFTPTPNAALYLDENFFNPTTQQPLGMDVRVDVAGQVKVVVFNIVGEEVVKLLDQYENVGNYRVYWDGKNRSGSMTGNAVYFIVVQQPSGHMVRKVIVLK